MGIEMVNSVQGVLEGLRLTAVFKRGFGLHKAQTEDLRERERESEREISYSLSLQRKHFSTRFTANRKMGNFFEKLILYVIIMIGVFFSLKKNRELIKIENSFSFSIYKARIYFSMHSY